MALTIITVLIAFTAQSAPRTEQVALPSQVIEYCKKKEVSNPSDFSSEMGGLELKNFALYLKSKLVDFVDPENEHFEKPNYFKGVQMKGRHLRYIYSPKWGWLDMSHFASATLITSLPGITDAKTLSTMEKSEKEEQTETVSLSYEDSVSNMLGTYFHRYLKRRNHLSGIHPTHPAAFCAGLEQFLKELGYEDQYASCAPNLGNLSAMPEKMKQYQPSYVIPGLSPESSTDHDIQEWFDDL